MAQQSEAQTLARPVAVRARPSWQRTLAGPDAGVRAAVDLVAPGLIAARMTAVDGAPFGRFRASYRAAALDGIFRSPELAGRK